MKKSLLCIMAVFLVLMSGCGEKRTAEVTGSQMVCGSHDYEWINPLRDAYGEIDPLLFDGLMRRDGTGATVPALAESWAYDAATHTYTFHLRAGVTWHDGEPLCPDDVKFTIEAILDPKNRSLQRPYFEDVREITAVDERTVRIRLAAHNEAFLDYMTQPILPAHLLAGKDLTKTGFFRHPIGTGPYRIESWEAGKKIVLVRNEHYYRGAPKIERVIFRVTANDDDEAAGLADGEIDMARLTPKNADAFAGKSGFRYYDMKTTDYRAILYNFKHPYWQRNRDLIPAISCAVDREAIVRDVLFGQGIPAYGPLQRNRYNNPNIEHYDYNPAKARALLEAAGCTMGAQGYYERGGEEVGFVLSVQNDRFGRFEIVTAVAEQLDAVGIHCTVEQPAQVDWDGQMAYLIGWGSPLDADAHTYKVFGTKQVVNEGHYANPRVDAYLTAARQTSDPAERMRLYGLFQEELAKDPPYTFLCYVDSIYVTNTRIHGITEDMLLGHRGSGIFWNVNEWTVD